MQSSNKTLPTDTKIETYLDSIGDSQQQQDARTLTSLMQSISKQPPVLWGSSIIGFGSYHYKYESGREGDWMKIGFAPRKGKISLYVTGDASKYSAELNEMGKHAIGKGCIYINKLADIDIDKLTEIISKSYANEDWC